MHTAVETPHRMSWLVVGAPLAAVISGVCAHFFADRQPLLIPMMIGIVATSFALARGGTGLRVFLLALAVGFLAWGGEQIVYSITHVAAGEQFEAERFGPQWAQVLGLTLAHAVFLGLPSGLLAGLLLHVPPLRGSATG